MATGSFLLVMLTLNAHTGEVEKMTTIGKPFPTLDECTLNSIHLGPQMTDARHAQMLVCRSTAEKGDGKDPVAPGADVS